MKSNWKDQYVGMLQKPRILLYIQPGLEKDHYRVTLSLVKPISFWDCPFEMSFSQIEGLAKEMFEEGWSVTRYYKESDVF